MFFFMDNTNIAKSSAVSCISDMFTGVNYSTISNVDTDSMSLHPTVSRICIRISKSKLATKDINGFKAWLQANPVTVHYELATPVETPINDLVPVRTYDGVTNIFTEGSLIEPIIKGEIPSNIPAKIQTLSMENKTLQVENIKFRNTLEDNNLTNIETSVNQESKITMMELGVI
ncbi:MAG TPA: hypothetical protein DCM59_08820 [Clostridium sp.]|nr:hypothetical protein [Clostridium sp.]